MPDRLVGSPVTCSRDSWRSKYKQHCWVDYDSTGGVRQLTKCLTCSYCAHDLLHENSLNNTNINNNNNRIFSLNILHVIQVKVSAWPLGAELEAYRLQPMLEETSPAICFMFSHAQIMLGRKLGNIPHCQTSSGDSICPCWGPHRLQNSSLGQLEDMIRAIATSGA